MTPKMTLTWPCVVADCVFVGTSSCQAFVAYQATYSFELYPSNALSAYQTSSLEP